MTEKDFQPEKKYAAFRKGEWGDGVQFYIGDKLLERIKDKPSIQAYDIVTLQRAVLINYPKPVKGLSQDELNQVRETIIKPKPDPK